MLGLSDTVTVALVTGGFAVMTAAIAAVGSVLSRKLDTGNGHSIGKAMAFVEDRLMHHDNRLDRIEVKVDESLAQNAEARTMLRAHLEEVEPLIAKVRERRGE